MTPSGPIRTRAPQGGSFGIDWSNVTRYEDEAQVASDESGTPLDRILATVVIESQGEPTAVQQNNSNGWSYGLMQIVPYGVGWAGHWERVKTMAGLPRNAARQRTIDALLEPALNLRVGAAILSDLHAAHGSWDKASSAFFTGKTNWEGADSMNGTMGGDYRRALNELIAEYGAATPVPAPSPVIYDLARNSDASRFGLTTAERDRILDNRYTNRNGNRPEVIVYHVQDGFTSGSLDWWANGPGVQASSTVMVQQDGSVLYIIPEKHGPWTNGDSKSPSARARALQQRYGTDLNPVSLTIEAEDGGTTTINAKQKATILWLVDGWIEAWPHLADPERHLGHFDINSVDKDRCGRYRDSIVAALGTTPEPEPIPDLPAWLTEAHVLAAFPDFSRTGIVSKAFVRYIATSGTLPIFRETRKIDENSSLWIFDRVVIVHEGASAVYEGETP